MELRICFRRGYFELELEGIKKLIFADKLTASNLLEMVGELAGNQKITAIKLDIDRAPASRARTVHVVAGILNRRAKIIEQKHK